MLAKDRANELLRKVHIVQKLNSTYKDLIIAKDRWGHERFCSKEINAIADHVSISGACGCCSDTPLYAWIFIQDPETGERIYTEPPYVVIGNKLDGLWVVRDVEKALQEYNITNLNLCNDINIEVETHNKIYEGEDDEIEEERPEDNGG